MPHLKLTYLEKLIHEMNTPLNTIYLLTDIELQNKTAIGKNENLKHIYSATEKLIKIVNLLSSITNLKSDKVKIKLEMVDLIDLVKQEIKYHQIRIKQLPELSIKLKCDALKCMAQVDKFWLEQLLSNLIINAINHSEKGVIEIAVDIYKKNEVEYFSLNVSDEGNGIPDDELETIFLPLKRGTHSVGKVPGSGIGLAIAREVAKEHGGTISARNNPNSGAVFEVIFPLKN